jgi:hypothetical protein
LRLANRRGESKAFFVLPAVKIIKRTALSKNTDAPLIASLCYAAFIVILSLITWFVFTVIVIIKGPSIIEANIYGEAKFS